MEESPFHVLLSLCAMQLTVSHGKQTTGGLEGGRSIPSISVWILWPLV